MPQTVLLAVESYEIDAGTNTTNPMGLMIRVVANQGGATENLRMYFYHPDVDQPELVGWRALSDGAMVLFLQRRDFANYVLMLDQAKAIYVRARVEDNDDITRFELSTVAFASVDVRLQRSETDAAEFEKRRVQRMGLSGDGIKGL